MTAPLDARRLLRGWTSVALFTSLGSRLVACPQSAGDECAWTYSGGVAPATCNDGEPWREACCVLDELTRSCVRMMWGDSPVRERLLIADAGSDASESWIHKI